jgi:hypothetical protein
MRARVGISLVLCAMAMAVLTSACGHAGYAPATPDVPAAIDAAGAEVTAQGSAANRYTGGAEGSWFTVARPGSSEPGVFVAVLPFDSEAARDRAFGDIRYRMRRLAHTVVFTWDDSVVVITRIRDWGLLQDLASEFEAAGAG